MSEPNGASAPPTFTQTIDKAKEREADRLIAHDAEMDGRHDEAALLRKRASAGQGYNYCAIIVGPPGCGKTSLAAALAVRHLHEGGLVFAHDPVHQFAKYGCAVYKDARQYQERAAVAHKDGRSVPRGAAIGGSAADVVALAMDIGKRNNRADAVRVKMLLVMDEMSLGASGSTWVDRADNELLATRRHLGIGIVMNVQQPNQLTERFWSMCTDVAIYRTTIDRARRLDQSLLLEKGTLERANVAGLEPHTYLHVKLGAGIVQEPM